MLVPPRTLGQDHHPVVTQFHHLVNGLCCILDGGAFGLGLDYPTTQSSTATSLLCISGLATCGKSTQALSGHCSREWNLSPLQNHLLCISEQKNWEFHGQLLFILSWMNIESLLPLCEALARLTLDSVLASKETTAYTGQYIIITMWWELFKRYNWGAREHKEEKAAWSDGLWAQRWVGHLKRMSAGRPAGNTEMPRQGKNHWGLNSSPHKGSLTMSSVWVQSTRWAKTATNHKTEISEAVIKLHCSLN